jgi:hypothetical protein
MSARAHLVAALALAHVLYVALAPLPPYAVSAAARALGRPYAVLCGTDQRWAMFGSPPVTNGRLDVSVEEDGAWRLVYRERSPDAAWSRATFDHYRWREELKQFHGAAPRADWEPFARWVAGRLFREDPRATAVRIDVRLANTPRAAEMRVRRGLSFDAPPVRSLVVPRE